MRHFCVIVNMNCLIRFLQLYWCVGLFYPWQYQYTIIVSSPKSRKCCPQHSLKKAHNFPLEKKQYLSTTSVSVLASASCRLTALWLAQGAGHMPQRYCLRGNSGCGQSGGAGAGAIEFYPPWLYRFPGRSVIWVPFTEGMRIKKNGVY